MARPAISLVLLNCNHGRFLGTALDGLIAAIGPDDEILGFDDGSTDDSLAVYRDYAARCPQLQVIAKPRNQGVVACMNEGLALASKELFYSAASDDCVDPPFLDRMAALLDGDPQAGLAGCRTRLIDEEGHDLGILQTPKVLERPGFLTPERAAQAFMEDDYWLVGIATVYRRNCLIEEGGFCAELESFADGFAARAVAMRFGACYSPEVLTSWRRMAEGYATSQFTSEATVERIAAKALDLMAGPYAGVFPAGYGARWKGRALFGARFYGWQRRQDASHPEGAGGGLMRVVQALMRVVWGAILFLRYRPGDLWNVAKRRIGYFAEGKSGT